MISIKMMTIRRKYFAIFSMLVAMLFITAGSSYNFAQEKNTAKGEFFRFEHLATNVADPIKVAKWYEDNLGLKLIRKTEGPTFTHFIADPDGNMMFELFYNAAAPLFDASKFSHSSFHVAFSVPDIDVILEKLIKAGAKVEGYVRKTSSQDGILNLRDPWGLPIQFVQRTKPILKGEGLRFEHIGINVEDVHKTENWYLENLKMIVIRESKSNKPDYSCFISDAGKHIMLELYHTDKAPVINFNEISVGSLHLASMTNDVYAVSEKLAKAGAKEIQDIIKVPGGDLILGLSDPWGFPLQFVTRTDPMLK